MGGGDPVADASASQYPVVAAGGWTGAVNPTTGVPMSSGFGGEAPIWLGGQSDAPLNQPMASQTAYPNPWEVIPYWPGVVRPGMPYVAV